MARKGNEPWKYTDVRPLAAEAFQYETAAAAKVNAAQLFPPDDGMARIAFVNGRFSEELSTPAPDGLVAMSLARALEEHSEDVQCHLARHAAYTDAPFTALNTAFLADGAFVASLRDGMRDYMIA